MSEVTLILAFALTVGVLLCHKYNGDEWDYGFGLLFFAGLPFAGLLDDGFIMAVWGYNLGAMLLIGMTVAAYLVNYQQTGTLGTAV